MLACTRAVGNALPSAFHPRRRPPPHPTHNHTHTQPLSPEKVSTDYTNERRSGVVDALSTQVIDGSMVKIYAWWVMSPAARMPGAGMAESPHCRACRACGRQVASYPGLLRCGVWHSAELCMQGAPSCTQASLNPSCLALHCARYDNEMGYSCRYVDVAAMVARSM